MDLPILQSFDTYCINVSYGNEELACNVSIFFFYHFYRSLEIQFP